MDITLRHGIHVFWSKESDMYCVSISHHLPIGDTDGKAREEISQYLWLNVDSLDKLTEEIMLARHMRHKAISDTEVDGQQ